MVPLVPSLHTKNGWNLGKPPGWPWHTSGYPALGLVHGKITPQKRFHPEIERNHPRGWAKGYMPVNWQFAEARLRRGGKKSSRCYTPSKLPRSSLGWPRVPSWLLGWYIDCCPATLWWECCTKCTPWQQPPYNSYLQWCSSLALDWFWEKEKPPSYIISIYISDYILSNSEFSNTKCSKQAELLLLYDRYVARGCPSIVAQGIH